MRLRISFEGTYGSTSGRLPTPYGRLVTFWVVALIAVSLSVDQGAVIASECTMWPPTCPEVYVGLNECACTRDRYVARCESVPNLAAVRTEAAVL